MTGPRLLWDARLIDGRGGAPVEHATVAIESVAGSRRSARRRGSGRRMPSTSAAGP